MMKKIVLILLLATLSFSCKDDTKEKVKAATQAVTADLKQAADSAKVKVAKVIDTVKVKSKFKNAIEKGAEKVENGAKKLKESVKK
jgi:PBP1b-binding outer membrane lipoprotein LpoB